MRCALCGFEFDEKGVTCTHGCPLGQSCNLTRCPSCGYEFPSELRTIGRLRRWFGRAKPAPSADGTLCLTDLGEGETAEVVRLSGATPRRQNALAVYGVLPGSRIVLQQKRPTFVIRVGETELALESSIAAELVVRRVPSAASAS